MRRVTRPISAFQLIAIVFSALLLTYGHPLRAATPTEGAQNLVQTLSDKATALLNQSNSTSEQQVEAFRGLLRQYFASSAIGKWVLGRYWRQATEAERKEYLKLFEDYIVYGYVKRFSNYSGEQLKILRAASNDQRSVTVYSEFSRPSGDKPIRVDWRVGHRGDSFRITDVMVEGTSLSQTLRSDFASTIHQGGGQVESLLVVLRQKVAQLKLDLGIAA